MRAGLAIAGVELRRFLRDRSNIFFVFIFPLLLVLVIGSQFGGGGGNGRVAISGSDSPLRSAVTTALRDDGVAVGGEAGTPNAASRSQRLGYPIIHSTNLRRPAVPSRPCFEERASMLRLLRRS